jgi:hypothetical protein
VTAAELKKRLRGRRIVDIDVEAFRDGKGGWAWDPTIHLDDGARVYFTTQETEVGRYGVAVSVLEPKAELPAEVETVATDGRRFIVDLRAGTWRPKGGA